MSTPFLDILRIGDWIDALPRNWPDMPKDDQVAGLLRYARDQLRADLRFTELDEMMDLDRVLPRLLHSLYTPQP